MIDFNDIYLFTTQTVSLSTLPLPEQYALRKLYGGDFIDKVAWPQDPGFFPRIILELISDSSIHDMLRAKQLRTLAKFVNQAQDQGAEYLEFIPGSNNGTFKTADIEKSHIPEKELEALLRISSQDIHIMTGKDQVKLPRLLCDSMDVKKALQDENLSTTWTLYHQACSERVTFLEISGWSAF